MFEEYIKEKLKAAAVVWAAQKNSEAEAEYLNAARNWALNMGRGLVQPPPPVPPKVVEFVVEDGGIVASEKNVPVSNVKPESFLPTYGTDTGAVNDAIGGPIPGQPGKFYQTAGSNPIPGTVVSAGGANYVYQRPTPFGGFWLKL